jgi:hypothetical protein
MKYQLSITATIQPLPFGSGALTVREEVVVEVKDFEEMAQIMKAFHVLTSQYKAK